MPSTLQVGQVVGAEVGMEGNGEHSEGRRRLATTGIKRLLAIRFDTPDSATSYSEAELSEHVFEAAGSIGTQLEKCSYGALKVVKAPKYKNLIGDSGVISVFVNQTAKRAKRKDFQNAAIVATEELLGVKLSLRELADHVLMFFPKVVEHFGAVVSDKC